MGKKEEYREEQIRKITTPYDEQICPCCLGEGKVEIENEEDEEFQTQIWCMYGGCGFVMLEDYDLSNIIELHKEKEDREEEIDAIKGLAEKYGYYLKKN